MSSRLPYPRVSGKVTLAERPLARKWLFPLGNSGHYLASRGTSFARTFVISLCSTPQFGMEKAPPGVRVGLVVSGITALAASSMPASGVLACARPEREALEASFP